MHWVPVPNSQHNFLAKGFATTIIAGPEAPQLVLMYGGRGQLDFTGSDPVKRAAQSEPLKSLSYWAPPGTDGTDRAGTGEQHVDLHVRIQLLLRARIRSLQKTPAAAPPSSLTLVLQLKPTAETIERLFWECIGGDIRGGARLGENEREGVFVREIEFRPLRPWEERIFCENEEGFFCEN